MPAVFKLAQPLLTLHTPGRAAACFGWT